MKQYGVWFTTFGLAAALGCAGESLNDVGDLNTADAGESGAGDGSGATAGTTGGATGGGSGGATGGQTMGGSGGSTGGTAGDGGGATGGGTLGGSGGIAGGGDSGPNIGPCNEGDGCVFGEGTGIRALAADATHLYWVEYGTSDERGNYNNDGRLLSRAFDSPDVTILATDLLGPLGVAVTSTHAYAIVDRVWQAGGERYAHLRVPLAGGEPQTVYVDLSETTYGKCGYSGKCFYPYEDAGYWWREDGIWEVTAASDEAVRISEEPLGVVGVDETYVYCINVDYGPHDNVELYRIPRTGGEPEIVTNDAGAVRHAVSGEYVYALDRWLSRMPKTGGRWEALADVAGSGGYDFTFVGDDFFFDAHPGTFSVTRGSLADPAAAAVIIYLPSEPESWVGVQGGAYWTDGSTIYFRAVD